MRLPQRCYHQCTREGKGRRRAEEGSQTTIFATYAIAAGFVIGLLTTCQPSTQHEPAGSTYAQWHPVTLSFKGPATSEAAQYNPFLHYRLLATFTHGDTQYEVPGFYAADGQADESGADGGSAVGRVAASARAEAERRDADRCDGQHGPPRTN